ncbi:hypothetical protein CRG98_026391 [Punica granatum]|uniref:Uncharacterized protein n=1 Tax=Punica granatum TaxID=22663 RepID=A0A2I0JAH0_PUNGR|nr:hypothetical protein CRG98_026391 [Punica granatum]
MPSIITSLQGLPPAEHPKGHPFVTGSYNGQKMHSNKFLLTDVLKNKLGFKVLGPHDVIKFHDDLMSLVEAGEVPISRIDDAVERIRVKFAAGIFGPPLSDRSLLDLVGCKLHRERAREAVRKSLVLLKNGKDPEKPLLSLD